MAFWGRATNPFCGHGLLGPRDVFVLCCSGLERLRVTLFVVEAFWSTQQFRFVGGAFQDRAHVLSLSQQLLGAVRCFVRCHGLSGRMMNPFVGAAFWGRVMLQQPSGLRLALFVIAAFLGCATIPLGGHGLSGLHNVLFCRNGLLGPLVTFVRCCGLFELCDDSTLWVRPLGPRNVLLLSQWPLGPRIHFSIVAAQGHVMTPFVGTAFQGHAMFGFVAAPYGAARHFVCCRSLQRPRNNSVCWHGLLGLRDVCCCQSGLSGPFVAFVCHRDRLSRMTIQLCGRGLSGAARRLRLSSWRP